MLRNSPGLTNTVDNYSVLNCMQTRNSGVRVTVTEVIDDTEGKGAIDTLPLAPFTRNLDIGGGQFNSLTEYLFKEYRVINYVYDPFNRSHLHNFQVLKAIADKPTDTVISNSVLNVILDKSEREKHIQLAYRALRKEGTAFFKVWRGDGSAVSAQSQSNKEALHYFGEIADIFGDQNVSMPQDDIGNTIVAIKI